MLTAQAMAEGATALAAGAARADPSRLHGLSRWLVGLYNEHRLLYALVTVGMLWTAGMLLGVGIEFALRLLGRETERLDLNE